jgi:hypothetical protein
MRNLAVLGLVTGKAAQCWRALSVHSALHVHGVRMIVVALQGTITQCVAVQATGAGKNGGYSVEGLKTFLVVSCVCLGTSRRARRDFCDASEQNKRRRANAK